jgi:hypothetical protein
MEFLRRHLLGLVLLTCVAVAGVELWWLARTRETAGRSVAALARAVQERDWLARQAPAPSVESEQAIAAEIAALRARIAAQRTRLQPRVPAPAEAVPDRPLDAYFEIANLVERARAQAIATRVTLRPDERFGFAAYANEGPAPDLLATVHRQQRAVQQVLEPLWEARPLALLGVKRAQPPGTGATRLAGEDYFVPEPAVSLRREGLVETEALRLEFTGQTSTLRAFLGGLADLREPAVVRSVEVEPVPSPGVRRTAAGGDAPVPVVRHSLSKFAVTVEFIQLADSPAEPAS